MDRKIAADDGPHLNHTNIYIYQCGSPLCPPGHFYGPAVRNHYLIHYIHSGKEIFQVGDITYELKAGNGFLICPDIVTYYQADKEDPSPSWLLVNWLNSE